MLVTLLGQAGKGLLKQEGMDTPTKTVALNLSDSVSQTFDVMELML